MNTKPVLISSAAGAIQGCYFDPETLFNYVGNFPVFPLTVASLNCGYNNAGAAGQKIVPFAVSASGATAVTVENQNGNGASAANSVGAASAQIKAANPAASWLCVQNKHATQTLYLSFTNPATANDIEIPPGSSITFDTAPTNALFGLGSGAATTFAIMEITAA